jgi:tRNA (guanine37-N1)-methyltransferase
LQLDVFTSIPHAFGWLTEHPPVANVLGESLELRLLNYRDTTPLRAGQIDDEPYGGGSGMILRVDVVAAALDAVYGGTPEHKVIAVTPAGRPLDQHLVEELAAEDRLTIVSARYEGFDERIVAGLASDAISIGPYVLSGGELPAMVILDAVARLLPGALGNEDAARLESFSSGLEGGLEYPQYTRPAEFRGWVVPDVLRSGDHARIERWRREQSKQRSSESERHGARNASESGGRATHSTD